MMNGRSIKYILPLIPVPTFWLLCRLIGVINLAKILQKLRLLGLGDNARNSGLFFIFSSYEQDAIQYK